MPDFDKLSDREILIVAVEHRTIAEQAVTELMRRAHDNPTHNV
jgi:hypothetical protein